MRQITLPDGLTVFGLNPDETRFMHREIFAERCYLQHGLQLRDGDCIFDVGANTGMATLFFHRERSGLRIFAFEPNPAAAACLAANVESFAISARIFQCGLMAKAGSDQFTLYPGNSLASGFCASPERERATTRTYMINGGVSPRGADRFVEALFRKQTILRLPVRTLSEVMDEERVDRMDMLKVNVEHSERQVLDGIREDHWGRIRQMVVEVSDEDGGLEEVKKMLRSRGFAVTTEQEPRLRGTGLHNLYAMRERD